MGTYISKLFFTTYINQGINTENEDEDDSCPICYESMENIPTLTLKCGHKFHTRCSLEWVSNNNTCPYCRDNPLPNINEERLRIQTDIQRLQDEKNLIDSLIASSQMEVEDIEYQVNQAIQEAEKKIDMDELMKKRIEKGIKEGIEHERQVLARELEKTNTFVRLVDKKVQEKLYEKEKSIYNKKIGRSVRYKKQYLHTSESNEYMSYEDAYPERL
jgi:hypothetical protein